MLPQRLKRRSGFGRCRNASAKAIGFVEMGEGAEVGVYGENGGETTRQGTFPVFHLASASARAVLRLAGAGAGGKGGGAKRTKGE